MIQFDTEKVEMHTLERCVGDLPLGDEVLAKDFPQDEGVEGAQGTDLVSLLSHTHTHTHTHTLN